MKRLGLLRAGSPRALVALVAIAGFTSACSLINKPDDIIVGSGGNDTGGGGSGANGGGPPACTENDECTALTTDCATGECVDGACVATPQPADTACGPALGDSCDVQDTCDGDGTCVVRAVPDGTYCDDCPAGAPDCALCSAGACGDCGSGRATEKTFRTPLSASGWRLTGGWGIYSETPPTTLSNFPEPPQCDDGIDNDGNGSMDFPDDPSCGGPEQVYEQVGYIPECNDGVDNDGDGEIDTVDVDCATAFSPTEYPVGPIVFDHPVLGTDGNRRHPYGKALAQEEEVSSATSPATVLPAEIIFKSWNMDEGYFYDLKAVQVSLDGTSFTTLAACVKNTDNNIPFCEIVSPRAADNWDTVTLPVPAAMVGQVGFVRFVHDSTDACCQDERGWYIDALNFAQDCACASDDDCAYAGGECGTATCLDTLECAAEATNVGQACTLDLGPNSEGCATAECNAAGFCAPAILELEGESCDSCSEGDGFCDYCSNGTCRNCPATQGFDQCFSPYPEANCNGSTGQNVDTSAWQLTGGWGISNCVSANQNAPGGGDCFMRQPYPGGGEPHLAPVMGNNGVRTTVPTYDGQSETASGSFITSPTPIPAELTFYSWHQDRGGNDTFNLFDRKAIRVSTDGGNNWTTIVDCDANMTVPFCQPWETPNTNRSLTDWDEISLPIPANLVGETGIFEFFYDTVDNGEGWIRGWYIDDLNISRCDYLNPPWPIEN